MILPETGRWQPRERLTQGAGPKRPTLRRSPSTMLRMVPLPVPGRI